MEGPSDLGLVLKMRSRDQTSLLEGTVEAVLGSEERRLVWTVAGVTLSLKYIPRHV